MSGEDSVTVTSLGHEDWDAVRAIYSEGIATGQATFEVEAPTWAVWDSSHFPFGRLVARQGGKIAGWAALAPVSDRCVYGGVAEVSLYVGAAHRGEGIGSLLLSRLIEVSERHGIWTLQAGIFPENLASVQVHRRAGFRDVGVRERLGKLNGRWRNVLLMERRSTVVGK